MPGMKLVADPALRASSGTFGAKVEDGALRLPPEVYRFAKWSGVATAEAFLAEAQSRAETVMVVFAWDGDSYERAIEGLKAILRGLVPEVVLGPAPRGAAALGGAPPQDYAEVFGEIAARSEPEEPKREERTVIVDGMPSVDGFEE